MDIGHVDMGGVTPLGIEYWEEIVASSSKCTDCQFIIDVEKVAGFIFQ